MNPTNRLFMVFWLIIIFGGFLCLKYTVFPHFEILIHLWQTLDTYEHLWFTCKFVMWTFSFVWYYNPKHLFSLRAALFYNVKTANRLQNNFWRKSNHVHNFIHMWKKSITCVNTQFTYRKKLDVQVHVHLQYFHTWIGKFHIFDRGWFILLSSH